MKNTFNKFMDILSLFIYNFLIVLSLGNILFLLYTISFFLDEILYLFKTSFNITLFYYYIWNINIKYTINSVKYILQNLIY